MKTYRPILYENVKNFEDIFFARVDARNDDECWEWQGCKYKSGHGRVSLGGQVSLLAHRVMWSLHNKQDTPSTLLVRHSCDNSKCVNPHHLITGTYQDNANDAVERGRSKINKRRGENHYRARLSTSDVLDIRQQFQDGVPRQRIADKYKIHLASVYYICCKGGWSVLT